MSPSTFRKLEVAMPWLVIGSCLIIWEAAVRLFSVREFILPAPTVVVKALLDFHEPIISNSLFTLMNTLIGFAIALSSLPGTH
jgi:NitT/TauT family transport system permease protein